MKPAGEGLRSLKVARRFWPQVAEHRRELVVVGGASLLVTALELLKPWPLKWIVDSALAPTGPVRWKPEVVIGVCAAAALVFAVGAAVMQYFRAIRLAIIGHAVTRALRLRIFTHLARLSPRFHAKHKSGDLLMRLMGDAPMLQGMLVESMVELITRSLLIVGTISFMFYLDWVLAVVVLAIIPALLLVVRIASQRIQSAVRKQRSKEGDLAAFLHEAVAGTAVIQSLGRAEDTVHRFARSNRTSARAGLKATRLSAGLSARVESVLGTLLAVSLGLGAWRVATSGPGGLSTGDLLVFISYVRSLLKPIRSASKHADRVARGTACGERILEVLDSEIDVQSKPDAPPAPLQPCTLELRDVRFAYEPGKPALDDFNASFRRGEVAGLFGPSGAGKSTVTALSLRMHDPDHGVVLLDGIDVRELELESLRTRFGLCMQDTILFGESVRENLLLGRGNANDRELWDALGDAGADEFVRALPRGLDTQLGSAGVGLSGGQRRRLALARTLLRRSPILIVDEPFNGLDRAATKRVRDTLLRSAEDAIVVVVNHDREHLDLFDRVVWIRDGRAVADGTHAELMREQAGYREAVGVGEPGVSS